MVGFLFMICYIVLFPMSIGYILLCNKVALRDKFLYVYPIGLIGEMALYELVYLPTNWLGTKLSTSWNIFLTLSVIILVAAIIIFVRKRDVLGFKIDLSSVKLNAGIKFVLILFFVVLALQLIRAIFFYPIGATDDVTYIPMISDMSYHNAFYPSDIYSGKLAIGKYTGEKLSYKYVFTCYYAFISNICRTTGIHPLILCKTLMSVYYIILFYYCWFCFARWAFSGSVRRQIMFMFFLSIIAEFSAYSIQTISKRLFLYAWNGKGALCVITLPILFTVMAQFLIKNKMNFREILIVMVISIASVGNSLMGALMSPAMIMGFVIIFAILDKSLTKLLQGIICCIPLGIILILVLLYMKKFIALYPYPGIGI